MSPVISHRFISVIKRLAINKVFVRCKVRLREEKVFPSLFYNMMSTALFLGSNAQIPTHWAPCNHAKRFKWSDTSC